MIYILSVHVYFYKNIDKIQARYSTCTVHVPFGIRSGNAESILSYRLFAHGDIIGQRSIFQNK